MAGNDTNVEPLKGCEETTNNYHGPNMPSSDWHVNGNTITNASIGMVTMGNSMVESLSCSSAPMVDSFCPSIWDQPIDHGHNLGYCDMNVQNDTSTSSSLGPVKDGMGWTPNAIVKDGVFMPTIPRMLPHSLLHFPTDSAFIERAARFSCFNGGNFSQTASPFSVPDPLNPQSRGLGLTQGPQKAFFGNGSILSPGMHSQKHEMNMADVSKEASLRREYGNERGSPFKNEKRIENFMQSHDEAKNGVDVSGNQSDDAEFSGRGAEEELDGPSSKGLGFKKRKRTEQKTEHNENNEAPQPSVETAKNTAEIRQNQNPSSTSNPGSKPGKPEPQGSDPPKEEYIHVRARRGQATNSHSLAERIRREKISERMKFLQDLVPGCSKVTGKAVMLDEIINYVQSLQRQVEFLSMKLATVNPRLDFNMEGFLAKDILQPRAGLSSSLPFPHDIAMSFSPFQPQQSGLIQAGLAGMPNSSDALHRTISLHSSVACGGFREPSSQAPSVWEDELHNVVHNGFNSSSPNSQDLSVSLPGHMKDEP